MRRIQLVDLGLWGAGAECGVAGGLLARVDLVPY
jgi:hypothetical protein